MRDYKFREGNRIVSLFLGACSRTIKFESRLFPQITQVPYVTQKRFLSFFHLYQNTFDTSDANAKQDFGKFGRYVFL